jgi:glycosyltransferase involved in cell wall biosynthesis
VSGDPAPTPARPLGISAFVRCQNEEEYIVASLLSVYRVFDEIVVIVNRSTDRTRELVDELAARHDRIRVLEYPNACSAIGPGYRERVLAEPDSSLAAYYNWCLRQTRFSHVCKWDGDMIATPLIEPVRALIAQHDVILFDGFDVLGEHTTDLEPRIFRFDPRRTRYVDWDLYEMLQHDYPAMHAFADKCYLHMKLVKKCWLGRGWSNPNLLAVRPLPETGAPLRRGRLARWIARARRVIGARR